MYEPFGKICIQNFFRKKNFTHEISRQTLFKICISFYIKKVDAQQASKSASKIKHIFSRDTIYY